MSLPRIIPESGADSSIVSVRQELGTRIDWLIQLRWVAVLCTVIIILVSAWQLPNVLPVDRLLLVTAAVAVYNLAFWYYRRHFLPVTRSDQEVRRALRVVRLQITLDMLAVTALLQLAGGAENPFYLYYLVHVGLASAMLFRRDAFLFAGLASVLFTLLVLVEYMGWLPHHHLFGIIDVEHHLNVTYLLAQVFALVSTAFFQAVLISTIVNRLRERDRALRASHGRVERRTQRMKQLNHDLRAANAECKNQRDQLTTLNLQLREANTTLELHAQELMELNARLEAAEAARTQFTLLVTHELRAPVAAIQSYIKLILEGYVSADQQRPILERAEKRALDQLALIADLLELGRLRERARSQIQETHLDEQLRLVLDALRAQAVEAQIDVTVNVGADLPPLLANPDQIKSLWTNLISNAIKYTPPGGHVAIGLDRDNGHLVGTVSDTGIGIPVEAQPQIFSEFYRADNAKALTHHGTGLGLAIVKQIVESVGGDIVFHSVPNQGTTFTFRLPAGLGVGG